MKRVILPIIAILASLASTSTSHASPKDSYEKVYKECMQMEDFKADDDALNAVYKKLMAKLPPAEAAKLKEEQKSWIKECAKMVKEEGRPVKNLIIWTAGRREKLEDMLKKIE
jgi:uncharacterized protein YecT (DUF1311 family)